MNDNMKDKISMLNKVKITDIYLKKGNYEGFDFFKLVAETDKGIKLQTKLTAFEYNVLSQK